MGIKERISQVYGNMSKNEKKIADYCLSQPEAFKDLSVQELGERTQTSLNSRAERDPWLNSAYP